jgi:tetratricopeptide (TPR) repeat protein
LCLGIAAFGLALLFLVRLTARLDDWTFMEDQLQQAMEAVAFARRFCEARFSMPGFPPYAPLRLHLLPFLERCAGGFLFLSWGALTVALAGSIFLYVSHSLAPAASRRRLWLLAVLGLALVGGAAGLDPVCCDRRLESAAALLTRGQAEAASTLLEDLSRDRPQLLASPPFVYLLGEAHHRLNRASPARHFYLGARFYPERGGASPPLDLNRLRDEWTRATRGADPRQARMVRHLLAWAYIQEGFRGLRRSPATALPSFEQALALSPRHQQVRLYLAKSRLELREPTRALADLEEFEERCRFRFLNGLAQALRGDALFQMGRFPEARSFYERSLKTYHLANYRALKGLVGH